LGEGTKADPVRFGHKGRQRRSLAGIVFVSTGAVDVPGVIGHVGTVPGRNQINIANLSAGRRDVPAAPGEFTAGARTAAVANDPAVKLAPPTEFA